jgi:hypothetical protein
MEGEGSYVWVAPGGYGQPGACHSTGSTKSSLGRSSLSLGGSSERNQSASYTEQEQKQRAGNRAGCAVLSFVLTS